MGFVFVLLVWIVFGFCFCLFGGLVVGFFDTINGSKKEKVLLCLCVKGDALGIFTICV